MTAPRHEIVETREFLAAIDRALGELPPDPRRAVTLRDVEGLSTAQAAEISRSATRAQEPGACALVATGDGAP